MNFSDVIGQDHIKEYLITTAKNGRIPHAQLFVGKEGSGTLPMAIAYAKLLLCNFSSDKEACAIKCDNLQHPDLHFSFPVNVNSAKPQKPTSDIFLKEWRQFVTKTPYGNLYNWLQAIGVEKKQGNISKAEANNIFKKLQLKSFEGGFKIMIIWCADRLTSQGDDAANKLLKLIEEPPNKTIIILITEKEDDVIGTIRSRCQTIYFNGLSEQQITNALVKEHHCETNNAAHIAHLADGNYNKALQHLGNNEEDVLFEQWFVTWVRSAFKAKGNASVVQDLINWSDSIAKTGRELQKRFLNYCLQTFRQALLINYKSENLVFFDSKTGFNLSKLAPFIHSSNILAIEEALNEAIYHIERNGNAKAILLDLSMKLTRFLHKKEA